MKQLIRIVTPVLEVAQLTWDRLTGTGSVQL